MTIVYKEVSAQDTFTDVINIARGERLDLSVSGTFVGTITIQRRRSDLDNSDWKSLPETYAAATEQVTEPHGSNWTYRAGIASGDYTSGTAKVALAKG